MWSQESKRVEGAGRGRGRSAKCSRNGQEGEGLGGALHRRLAALAREWSQKVDGLETRLREGRVKTNGQ